MNKYMQKEAKNHLKTQMKSEVDALLRHVMTEQKCHTSPKMTKSSTKKIKAGQ